jgi:ABC-type multidrug transport system ATPase subunit
MKQRLGVALALLGDPPLVILDEPTAGLDPEERVFFRDLLTECAAGRVVILSTHIVGDIERCCSRVGIIVRGRLLYDGTPGELTQRVVGQVWEFPIEPEDMEAWVASRRVVGMVERGGGLLARVVTPEKPAPQATAVEATFEDAYMGTIGPAGAALTEA